MAFPTTNTILLFTLIISSLFSLQSAQPPPSSPPTLGFRCTNATTNCYSLIDYQLPNTTTISAVQSLFQIKNLRNLLAANNLPTTTPHNHTVPSSSILRIPFPCLCRNATGISNRRPIYTVVPNDGLFHIAAEVFSRLVTYPQIQIVNNITDPNTILVGQRLWIPLPCSCDEVGGEQVVHYGHFVAKGSTVEGIAMEFNTTEKTLLDLNGMADAKELQASSILDVPLKVCKTMVTSNSLDYPLLVPNGTSIYTANNCVRCRCDAMNNWILECEPSGLALPQGQTCPSTLCEGTSFNLGNITSGSGCSRSRCVYTGYTTDGRINTAISQDSTCPEANNNNTPGSGSKDWRPSLVLGASLIALHLLR